MSFAFNKRAGLLRSTTRTLAEYGQHLSGEWEPDWTSLHTTFRSYAGIR